MSRVRTEGSHWFADNIADGGTEPAIITSGSSISHADLARRADAWVDSLRAALPAAIVRPLVLMETVNHAESIIAYIGCLRARWPVILVAPTSATVESRIARTFNPNIIVQWAGQTLTSEVASITPVAMHPDLAVLLSTSGTTGDAKLVRLSRDNLDANARAIAEYLGVTAGDRAITTLPFHYSYGMSVLHTHLLQHAAIIVTESSVIDPDFWVLARTEAATSLALVPTQFELLEAGDWQHDWNPALRTITQAGGRLDPLLARRMADRAHDEGWSLYFMYGQTEAGPRMSYVPAEDARAYSDTIGRAIPGGSFRLINSDGQVITESHIAGELVFDGPGVMMGYARVQAELNDPTGPPTLHTGDIAERLDNGYYRIVGRASRFLKVAGLRVALDSVERDLREQGWRVHASGSDSDGLVLFIENAADAELDRLKVAALSAYHLPDHVVRAVSIASVPLLSSGKVDYRALAALAADLPDAAGETDLLGLLESALRTPIDNLELSFLDYGGDSLAYLNVQMQLVDHIGHVPKDWETLPISALLRLAALRSIDSDGAHAGARTTQQAVGGDLIVRLIAIFSVVALHSTDWPMAGGAYLLLVLAGFSVARFQTATLLRGDIAHVLRIMLVPLLSCYFVMISAMTLVWKPVPPDWFLLLGNYAQETSFRGLYPYWYVSAYAQCIVILALPFLVPAVRRATARAPFAATLVALAFAVLLTEATGVADVAIDRRHHHTLAAIELMLLGATMAYAVNLRGRLVATVALAIITARHWSDSMAIVPVMLVVGSTIALWVRSVPVPAILSTPLLWLGALTMFIYLAHPAAISIVDRYLPTVDDWLHYPVVVSLSVVGAILMRAAYHQVSGLLSRLDLRARG